MHSSGLLVLLRRLDTLDQPMPSDDLIDRLAMLAKRYSAVVAKGWSLPRTTVEALHLWACGDGQDPDAVMPARACAVMQARLLHEVGALDEPRWQALLEWLPEYAADWRTTP